MAKGNFDRSLLLVLAHEGGWADHPKDPGGATMKGVTLATFRRYRPGASKADLRNISDADLQRIYRDGYWNVIRGDDLPSGLDFAVFDYAVNSGPGRAAKHLQAVLGVPQDGKVGRIKVSLERAGNRVRVEVADNGPGIPAEDRGRVVERFVRLEKSRTEAGSGLGLSLVAAVAQLHKGELRLEDNAPGLRAVMELPG